MHEALVNHWGGLSLPRISVVSLTDRLNMTIAVYYERKASIQQQQHLFLLKQSKNLDPSYKMDLDFCISFGREISV